MVILLVQCYTKLLSIDTNAQQLQLSKFEINDLLLQRYQKMLKFWQTDHEATDEARTGL